MLRSAFTLNYRIVPHERGEGKNNLFAKFVTARFRLNRNSFVGVRSIRDRNLFLARLLPFSKGIPPLVPSVKHQSPFLYAVSRPIERSFATLQNSRRTFRLSSPPSFVYSILFPSSFSPRSSTISRHGFISDSLENRSSSRISSLGGEK